MTGPEVLDVARDAIVTLVLVASPLMLVGLIVGVAIRCSRRSRKSRR
jgi:flagellar biosynthetic protein FliQ